MERKNLVFFFLYVWCFFFIFFFISFLFMCSSEWLLWWILECRRGDGGWEEKGRVLGQADRDVSTASVILWRLREWQKKLTFQAEGGGQDGWKTSSLVTAEAERTPTATAVDAGRGERAVLGEDGSVWLWQEEGGVWGVKPGGEKEDLQLHVKADS